MAALFVIFLVVIIGLLIWAPQQNKKNQAIAKIREEQEKKIKEQELEHKRKEETILENRIKEFGELTKKIHIDNDRLKDIYVYEETKTIFILGNKYLFNDILSCYIEKKVTKGQTKTMVTQPNKMDMWTQELLYGQGKKYNVKTETKVYTTPERVKYVVYIGINNLANPQISFVLSWSEKANEVNNLINAIIARNTK